MTIAVMLIHRGVVNIYVIMIAADGKTIIIATIDIETMTMSPMEDRLAVMTAEAVDNTKRRIAIVTTNDDIVVNETTMKITRSNQVKLFEDAY
jgi:hypothetical protein